MSTFANEAEKLIFNFWNDLASISVEFAGRDILDPVVRRTTEAELRGALQVWAERYVTKDFKQVIPADKTISIGRKGLVDYVVANYFAYALQGQWHNIGNLYHTLLNETHLQLTGPLMSIGRSWTGQYPIVNANTRTSQLYGNTTYVVKKNKKCYKLAFMNTDYRGLIILGPHADYNTSICLNQPLNPSLCPPPEGYAVYNGINQNEGHYPRPPASA